MFVRKTLSNFLHVGDQGTSQSIDATIRRRICHKDRVPFVANPMGIPLSSHRLAVRANGTPGLGAPLHRLLSEKVASFSDKPHTGELMQSIDATILRRIRGFGPGAVFVR